MTKEKLCPLCSSALQAPGYPADETCPKMVVLPSGKIVSHYTYQSEFYVVAMIVLPYKIINKPGFSKISRLMTQEEIDIHYANRTILDWKPGPILITPLIHPDTEDKLLERVKRLLVLS